MVKDPSEGNITISIRSNRSADLSSHPPQVAWMTEPFNPEGGWPTGPSGLPRRWRAPHWVPPRSPPHPGGVGQTREPNSAFRRGRCCPIFRFGCVARVADAGFLTWSKPTRLVFFIQEEKTFPPPKGE